VEFQIIIGRQDFFHPSSFILSKTSLKEILNL
jgi:hypothetical protein